MNPIQRLKQEFNKLEIAISRSIDLTRLDESTKRCFIDKILLIEDSINNNNVNLGKMYLNKARNMMLLIENKQHKRFQN